MLQLIGVSLSELRESEMDHVTQMIMMKYRKPQTRGVCNLRIQTKTIKNRKLLLTAHDTKKNGLIRCYTCAYVLSKALGLGKKDCKSPKVAI